MVSGGLGKKARKTEKIILKILRNCENENHLLRLHSWGFPLRFSGVWLQRGVRLGSLRLRCLS